MMNSVLIIVSGFLLGLLCCWFLMTYMGMGKRSLQIMKKRYQKLDESFEDLEKSFQKQDQLARTERKNLLDRIKFQDQSITELQTEKKHLIIDAQMAETGFLSETTELKKQLDLLATNKLDLEQKIVLQSREIHKLAEEIEVAKSRGAVAQSSDAEMKMLQHSMTRLREMMEQEGAQYRKQIEQLNRQLEAALSRKPQVDDLTQISGVGHKIQELLNSIGITNFQQIAEAEPKTIAKIKDVLGNFADRVERDDWLTQAQKLMTSV